jgi:hypothetical protein
VIENFKRVARPGARTPNLVVRSRTLKPHKLMNRRHMPLSNPLSIGYQSGTTTRGYSLRCLITTHPVEEIAGNYASPPMQTDAGRGSGEGDVDCDNCLHDDQGQNLIGIARIQVFPSYLFSACTTFWRFTPRIRGGMTVWVWCAGPVLEHCCVGGRRLVRARYPEYACKSLVIRQ